MFSFEHDTGVWSLSYNIFFSFFFKPKFDMFHKLYLIKDLFLIVIKKHCCLTCECYISIVKKFHLQRSVCSATDSYFFFKFKICNWRVICRNKTKRWHCIYKYSFLDHLMGERSHKTIFNTEISNRMFLISISL